MSDVDAVEGVRVENLHLAFGTNRVLRGVDLTVRRGEFVVLLGPSGTGKSTLLRILAGLQRPDSGTVLVPEALTYVYQEPRLVPSMRVLANVLLGLPRTPANRQRALATLAEVGLQDKTRQWPHTLSGGEAQRVALARALVREPDLLVLDEPFAALDALTRITMQETVRELVLRHHPAVLMVTHDVDEAIKLADRVLVLDAGTFALDVRLDYPGERRRDDERFNTYRSQLLAVLGVH